MEANRQGDESEDDGSDGDSVFGEAEVEQIVTDLGTKDLDENNLKLTFNTSVEQRREETHVDRSSTNASGRSQGSRLFQSSEAPGWEQTRTASRSQASVH